ncbi:MAG: DUF167 domain-containing protein [Myxococcales bacterium]|jgi:uncharacterized protein (TIGR00251 family)|nr:DUF167 domain-containing protein [Myxococcales bacterium]
MPPMSAAYLRTVAGGVELALHVQPRASKTGIAGEHGDRLKLRLAAPPVDGAANEELIRFFADLFDVQKRAVEIVSGESGRQKRVIIRGVDAAFARERIGR